MKDPLSNAFDGPAFSINQFCAHYGISRTGFNRMVKRGIAPFTTPIVDNVRILYCDRMQWEASRRAAAARRDGQDDPSAPTM